VIFKIKSNSLIRYREGLGEDALSFLKGTLEVKPELRIDKMSKHALFAKVDWEEVKNAGGSIMRLEALQPGSFCGDSSINDIDYTEENFPNRKINDWEFFDLELH
jgi:hypothetical protein